MDGVPTSIKKDDVLLEALEMEEKTPTEITSMTMRNNMFTHCVISGCAPKPGEWSSQVENACFDCV